jgi:hypothetical protein
MDGRTASRLIPHFGQAPDIFEGITFIDRVAGMFYEYRELMSSLNVFFERESQSKDKGEGMKQLPLEFRRELKHIIIFPLKIKTELIRHMAIAMITVNKAEGGRNECSTDEQQDK